MFFRQLMLVAVFALFVSAEPASAKVAPDYQPVEVLQYLPELQLEHGSARRICPIDSSNILHREEKLRLDILHLYDWAHPIETRVAREQCAIPAPDSDLFENIGQAPDVHGTT